MVATLSYQVTEASGEKNFEPSATLSWLRGGKRFQETKAQEAPRRRRPKKDAGSLDAADKALLEDDPSQAASTSSVRTPEASGPK